MTDKQEDVGITAMKKTGGGFPGIVIVGIVVLIVLAVIGTALGG